MCPIEEPEKRELCFVHKGWSHTLARPPVKKKSKGGRGKGQRGARGELSLRKGNYREATLRRRNNEAARFEKGVTSSRRAQSHESVIRTFWRKKNLRRIRSARADHGAGLAAVVWKGGGEDKTKKKKKPKGCWSKVPCCCRG